MHWLLVLIPVLLSGCGSLPHAQAGPVAGDQPESMTPAADQPTPSAGLLVWFHEQVPREQALELIRQSGAQIVRELKTLRMYHLSVPAEKGLGEMIEHFTALQEVKGAEPNYVRRPD